MRGMFRNNLLLWFLSSALIVSILWLGVFSAIVMHHGNGMRASCPIDFIGSGTGSQPTDSSFCGNIYMGMVQELAHTIPGTINFGMGLASVLLLVFFLPIRTQAGSLSACSLCRVRYRDQFDKDTHSYFSQIKKWISLCEERDPSYCLA
jgi:hypothetical protein